MKVIITGATGMVGEGVLLECLLDPRIEKVLVVGRSSCGRQHPKLSEILHPNFFDITPIRDSLSGYDALFFCAGVSAVGKSEKKYHRLTFELTTHFTGIVLKENPTLSLCYVSGAGTDSSEKGRMMWARVKGKTENHLLKMPFKRAFMFRPGFMKAVKGQQNPPDLYKYINWLFPLARTVFPSYVCTLREVGQAMINVSITGYPKPVLEVKDIVKAAKIQ